MGMIMADDTAYYKLPRLYVETSCTDGASITLTDTQAHYLRNVLRKQAGDHIRLFNGRDGEYLAQLSELGKKTAECNCIKQLKPQPKSTHQVHLIFSPIKKHRQDILIEKAVELGATDLHPVFMDHTQGKHFNTERTHAQIIEAAEQCERFIIPTLHAPQSLQTCISNWNTAIPMYWATERGAGKSIKDLNAANSAFLIGPEGGFSEDENNFLLKQNQVTPITLGETIYRVETAVIICLTKILLD